MRYVSLFSGIEAATVAWEPLGWEPVAFAEVDAFPSAVLAERFPEVPNLGDVTKIDWNEVVERYGAVDVVVGGSPCQSFSLAGNRDGLDGASGLMWEYVRAVREIRPRWLVWENVPGALSSGPGKGKGKQVGEDFGCLLRALDELGYGLCWRVLDAQFFGVAQRRRRVFLVGHLGAKPPVEVLFEPDGLRWDFESSRDTRQGAAGISGVDTTETGWGFAFAQNQRHEVRLEGGDGQRVGALAANADFSKGQGASLITDGYIVRRLTPRECERLQGFPDDWTLIPYRGKPAEECPDGPRYKALGNSMAVPVMRWIGERIAKCEEER